MPHSAVTIGDGRQYPRCKQYRDGNHYLAQSRHDFKVTIMENTYDEVMLALQNSQIQELSIIKISEPIASAIQQASGTRTSDVSQDAFESPSPSSLEADLSHYKVCSSLTCHRV